MPIFDDSYSTTLGNAFVVKDIIKSIQEAIIKDAIDNNTLGIASSGTFKPIFITGLTDSENEIPLFTHPISIFNFKNSNYLCTDLRLFIRKDGEIKNLTEYNFTKSRGILNLLWLNDEKNSLRSNLSFAAAVFSNWISETVARAYALDFGDQTKLTVLAYYYYYLLFSKDFILDEDGKQLVATKIIKDIKIPSDLIFSVLDRVTPITCLKDFCTCVKNITENVRLHNFDDGSLLTIIRNSWYGTNSKEILPIALEHPPTWIAIVYTSLNERTYKSSLIYKIAERLGKRGNADEFNKNYINLIKEHSVSNEELQFKIID